MKLRERLESICQDAWSHTILLSQGHPLLVRRGVEWIPDRSFQLNYADITAIQKEPGQLIGQTFDLDFIAEEKSLALVRKQGPLLKMDRWGIPTSYFEQLAKSMGFHAILASSPVFLQDLNRILQDDLKSRATFVLTDGKLHALGDFFFLTIKSEEQLRKAVRIAQSGRSVVAWFQHAKLDYWLQDQIMFNQADWATLQSVLKSVLAVQFVKGVEDPVVPVIEYLVNHASIKKALADRNLVELRETMKQQAQAVGFKTLHESLLNLVMRRRIDLKEAFLVAHDPSEFDQLLKTIGV